MKEFTLKDLTVVKDITPVSNNQLYHIKGGAMLLSCTCSISNSNTDGESCKGGIFNKNSTPPKPVPDSPDNPQPPLPPGK